jgi:hypothetical protein
MPEYVRVRVKENGHHWTVTKQEAENNPDAYAVLKQPAVNELGDPLPGEIPSSENAGQSADKKKES